MKIRPYEQNAKKHPKKQIDQIMASIKEFGMNQQIVVDKDGVIIVGHGRYEALQQLGWEIKDEYIKVVDLTEEQAKAYRLADNKLNESEWDMTLVIEELKGLSEPMLNLTGFDKDLIIEPDEKDDEVPETPAEPRSKLGDLYELGSHRVLCGDSTELEAVERLMDGKKADMVFTDPPYNVAYEGKTKDKLTIGNDNLSTTDFDNFLNDCFVNMYEAMGVGSPIYVTCPLEDGSFHKAFINSGLKLQSILVWLKDVMVMGRKDYHYKHEPILYGWKEGSAHFWKGGRDKVSTIQCKRPPRSSEHPTMKPVELITELMGNSLRDDGIVLDLFLGSGSTLIASEKTGRICYGMELDPKYVDVIVQRYVDYTGNTKIKCNGEDIEWTVSVK